MIEIWRDIKDYEGLYQVSNFGRVRSLNYHHTGKAEVMKPIKTTYGYFQVGLWKNGEKKRFYVHRLVAEAFLPKSDGKDFVNHKIEGEEGKTFNFVFFNEDGSVNKKKTTIEWCTSEENNNYGTRNERASKKMTNGKLSKRVFQLTLDGELIREWSSIAECERNGFNKSKICLCCQGKKPQYKGFRWKYS